MEHDHPLPKVGRKPGHHLGGEGNLRHQDHPPPSPADDLLEQADIHRRLSAAGDAVEQGAGGLLLRRQGKDPIKGGLLLLRKDDGRAVGRLRPRHPEGLLPGQLHQAAADEAPDGLQGGAGKIAQIAGKGAAHSAQELYHRVAHRSATAAGRHGGHGRLRLHRQGCPLNGLILDLPGGRGLQPDKAPLLQGPQHSGHAAAAGLAQCVQIGAPAAGDQGLQRAALPGAGSAAQGGLPVHRQGVHLPDLVPKPRRQNGTHGAVEGTEVPLPQPEGQLKPLFIQHGPAVQHGGEGLQPSTGIAPDQGQDQPLAGPVSPAEGDGDPDTHLDLVGQPQGHQVVVGLVDGVGGGLHRHLGDQRPAAALLTNQGLTPPHP